MEKKWFGLAIAACSICCALVFVPVSDAASPITLKCVSFLPKTDHHLTYFFKFIERVQEQSKGELKIQVVGGPEAIPSFEQIQAVRTGVVQLVATCSAYYIGDLKEALAFQYGTIPPLAERQVGFYDMMDKIHQDKLNVKYLGRFSYPGRFYFFSNKPLKKISDFDGKRIRSNPGYEPFVKALGANPMNTPFSEVFSVMERGVADAFAWPVDGPLSYGWESIFKYVILPGFYQMNTVAHMNFDAWKRLPDNLKKIIMDNVLWMEGEMVGYYEGYDQKAFKILKAEKGKELITVENPEAYLKMANDAAWKMVKEACPQTGVKMEEMIRK